MSLLLSFISIVVLLLTRGALPAGRLSLRQTSDDNNTMKNPLSPSHSAVVVVASSSPPASALGDGSALEASVLEDGSALEASALEASALGDGLEDSVLEASVLGDG